MQPQVQWFVGRNGEAFGPFIFDELRAAARSGELQRTDLVWHAGMEGWVSAAVEPKLWQLEGAREPIFLVPAILWVPFVAFVVVNAARLAMESEASAHLTSALAFVSGRYIFQPSELPGGAVALVTSPFTYFLVSPSGHEFLGSSWQILAYATFLSLHWGKVRFFVLLVLCILVGPAVHLLWNGFDLTLLVGADAMLGGLQGAALWLKKPDPRAIAEGAEPRTIRVTTGEMLAILFGFIPAAVGGSLPVAGFAMLFGFGIGALLRLNEVGRGNGWQPI